MTSWLYNNLPQAILLDLGLLKIYWYGLFITLAIVVSVIVFLKLTKNQQQVQTHFWNLFIYLIIFGLIGARFYHIIFYNLNYFISQPIEILMLWHGGLAIHGAIIAGLLVIYLYTKKHQLLFWIYTDLLTLVLPLGQAIGRWGNYFNQELYGKSCDFDWCIPIQNQLEHFHPVFLYESFLNLILFLVLLIIFKSKKLSAGLITCGYLIGYSIMRFFMEFLRLDVSQTIGGLKWVQWLCLVVIVVSGVGISKTQCEALPRNKN